MKNLLWLASIFFLGLLLLSCTHVQNNSKKEHTKTDIIPPRISALAEVCEKASSLPELTVTYPYQNSLFPPEISSPTITWVDSGKNSQWFITVKFDNGKQPIYKISQKNLWRIDKKVWEKIKIRGLGSAVNLTIYEFDPRESKRIISQGHVKIGFAPVGVEAAILYRQVPLPFPVNNLGQMKWRLGDIASYHPPKVIMQGLKVCASCHTSSKNGKYLSMEMNYQNDSGAQFIAPVRKTLTLSKSNFFSWNEVSRPGILPKSRGLFGRMSPNADYALATVNELSLALLTNDYRFSQVFFPTYGILASYSVADKSFSPLPGANDYNYVHTNPDWSPDQSHIVFARAKTKNKVHENIMDVSPKFVDEDIHSLNKRYNIQFDLYRIPFNKGSGGTASPLEGASRNSMSNYFPRHSPDGKWIVYTQSKTGIMLQPDSQLYIMPADGGKARKMRCNRKLFNSWHSWSPNSRWLLFSSKVNTPFTEIFLTYVDENGLDYPPVLLDRFSDKQFAANVPEFVNFSVNDIDRIVIK